MIDSTSKFINWLNLSIEEEQTSLKNIFKFI